MKKKPGEIIAASLEAKGLKAEALARLVGMKGDTLRKKIKGEREWRPKELSKIGDALNIPKSHLLGEDIRPFEPPQPIITVLGTQANILPGVKTEDYLAVPLVEGPIAAGYAGAIPGDYVRGLVWVYRPEIGKRQHHNLRAVQLAKDAHSMEPTIRSGDIVIVDPEDRKINPKAIYAVRLDSEGGCAIKRVRVSDNYVVLFSDNRDPIYGPVVLTKDRAENLIIGRVIWSWTSWVR